MNKGILHNIILEAIESVVDDDDISDMVEDTVGEINEFLGQFNLSMEVDEDYDDWSSLYGGHAVAVYEGGSVFDGVIMVGLNMEAFRKYASETHSSYMTWDEIRKSLYHEVGHGLVERIRDFIDEYGDDGEELYNGNKDDLDYILGDEEDAVEEFASYMVGDGGDTALIDVARACQELGFW